MLTRLPSNALRKKRSINDNMRHAPSSYSIIIMLFWDKGALVPLSLLLFVTVYTLYPQVLIDQARGSFV